MKAWRLAGVAAGLIAAAGVVRADDPPAASTPPPITTPGGPATIAPGGGGATGPTLMAHPLPPPAKVETVEELIAWMGTQKGAIEEIAGAKFTGEVPIKAATTDQLAERIGQSIEADMVGLNRPDGTPMTVVEIHIRSMSAAYKIATRTFGLYSHEDRVVYVAPGNVDKYSKKYGWSQETATRAPRLALAHEMVHALQDQKLGLGDRLARVFGEERAALTAMSEGQAIWVTDELAKKLDWSGANAVLWGLIAGVRDGEDSDFKAGAAPKLGVAPSAEIYSQGKKFIAYHAGYTGEGPKGAERVWMLVKNPPTTLEALKDPAKFEVKAEAGK